MSVSKLATACDAAARLVGDAGAQTAWRAISAILKSSGARTVASILKVIDGIEAPRAEPHRPALRDLESSAAAVRDLLAAVGSRTIAADFEKLLDRLARHADADCDAFAAAAIAALDAAGASQKAAADIDRALVGRYAARLEDALGDESFGALHRDLKSDPAVKVGEAKEIARKFTGRPGGSKKAALERIWDRHHALIDGRKRIEAMDGRSAA